MEDDGRGTQHVS